MKEVGKWQQVTQIHRTKGAREPSQRIRRIGVTTTNDLRELANRNNERNANESNPNEGVERSSDNLDVGNPSQRERQRRTQPQRENRNRGRSRTRQLLDTPARSTRSATQGPVTRSSMRTRTAEIGLSAIQYNDDGTTKQGNTSRSTKRSK